MDECSVGTVNPIFFRTELVAVGKPEMELGFKERNPGLADCWHVQIALGGIHRTI
jgi:hypothetical protein